MAEIPELAPEAPLVIEALPSLGTLAVLFLALGMCLAVDAVARAFFGTITGSVGWIPYVGKLVSSPIHKIEQKIVAFLSGLEHDIDNGIAISFHKLALIGHRMWLVLEHSAELTWEIAKLLTGHVTIPHITHITRDITKSIKVVERVGEAALAKVIHAEKVLAHSVAHGVYPRLRAAEHAIERTIPREIKTTRHLAREAEREALRAWRLVKTRPWEIGATAFAGAVALALSRLGLGWIRCNAARGMFNKRGCGMWSMLDDLLGLFADALLIGSLCDVLPWITRAVDDVGIGLVNTIHAAGITACKGTYPDPPALPAAGLSLPAVHGVGLSLG